MVEFRHRSYVLTNEPVHFDEEDIYGMEGKYDTEAQENTHHEEHYGMECGFEFF